MPLMNINFVIASENPKELSGFYAKINSDKASKGFNETHYFISLSNRSKIHFYRPNKNHEWQRKGNSTSLCFQREPCEDPSKIIESWTSEILKTGVVQWEFQIWQSLDVSNGCLTQKAINF